METAKHAAHENELYRRKDTFQHPSAAHFYAQVPVKLAMAQPAYSQLPLQPTASVHPHMNAPLTHNNTNVSSFPATLNLSQLTPAQLLQLQQQGAVAQTAHSQPPSFQPLVPQQPQLLPPPTTTTLPPLSSLTSPALSNTPLIPPPRPIYNGVNPNYPGLRVVHRDPPMFAVDNFLTPLECQFLIHHAQDSFGPAPVVGKGSGEISQARTSSTCYLARQDLPDLMRKVHWLTGKPMEHCELPQVGRYFATQQYLQHYDAFDLETEDGQRFAMNGGQRTITVLIYLNTVQQGGQTRFPMLTLDIQPQQGMALVFFPATIDGQLDKMALHAAMPAVDVKYVSQVWIRQSTYQGQASKRLPVLMGQPLMPTESGAAVLAMPGAIA